MSHTLNVQGLTAEQVRIVQDIIEIFRRKRNDRDTGNVIKTDETHEIVLGSYPLGVKIEITREEIYDYLRNSQRLRF